MLNLNFSMIVSPIHFIASLLINWFAICMQSEMKYCFKSLLKNIANGFIEKNMGPISLNIYRHDNNYIKSDLKIIVN